MLTLSVLLTAALGTSFLSAIFGMAGGVILKGVYNAYLPVAAAFILHGITQGFANGYRFWLLREHLRVQPLLFYIFSAIITVVGFTFLSIVPKQNHVFIGMGLVALLGPLLGKFWSADYLRPAWASVCGVVTTAVQLMCGVNGPLLDVFFIRTKLTKHEIVANKAATQTLSHGLKIVFFVQVARSQVMPFVDQAHAGLAMGSVAFAFLGTNLGKRILDRFPDRYFQKSLRIILVTIGLFYLYIGLR